MIFDKTRDNANRLFHQIVLALTIYVALSTTSMVASAQTSERVIPMGEWAEFITVHFDGKPLLVHLRTGYERAILFPEPVSLNSINNAPVKQGEKAALPNCNIELDADVMGFAPLKRFAAQHVELVGLHSGRKYKLLVSSSPNGKRQPIQIIL